ncbi:chromatin/chromatin-binding, or -regulatory protein [Lithospermum erythrorhizon]|uniref:Chromatin/chromatin-binding, or -regulatory protein n=1 Tax=Lithospermum erythrorhizon TaxID=34254 RepID=A0AAV3S1V7_LITER
MISAISWIPKGAAKSVPVTADPPSKEEIEEILSNVVLRKGEASEYENDDEDMDDDASKEEDEVAHALAAADALCSSSKDINTESESIAEALKELDMDNYDEEEDGIELFGSENKNLFYSSNDLDPYLKDNGDIDSEEEEDLAIKPEDTVIVCARNEDDVSSLEVWILEDSADGEKNMYTHHDIILPAFPLCTAWLDCPLKDGDKGNFIAVGSMDPAIEIWDLDVMDEVQPTTTLGGAVEKKKKGKKKSVKYKEGSHTDAVLGLAWNKEYRNILASASADKLVKIWDVSTGKCNITMEHHSDKACFLIYMIPNTNFVIMSLICSPKYLS